MTNEPDRWRISDTARGRRLDVYLAEIYEKPRNQVHRWIREGLVFVSGKTAKPALRLDGGEWISCEPSEPDPDPRIEAETGEISVLFEDKHLIVIDKPAGLAIHPGAGRRYGTVANRLLGAYPELAYVGGSGRPGIVHRLDIGTSGVMVVARTELAYRKLSEAFSERAVAKQYLALVFGRPTEPTGTISAPIDRHRFRRTEMTVSARGRPAETEFRSVAAEAGIALFLVLPRTGRTHQIRVHLKHLGHPILGDPVYGENRWKSWPPQKRRAIESLERPALHAWRLSFRHPAEDREVSFESAVPDEFADVWRGVTGAAFPELPE